MKMTVESVFKDADAFCQETFQEVDLKRKLQALALYTVGGSSLYGVTMGLNHSPEQAAVSALKVPVLFLLTLCICLPTLHFIGLLFGSTIRFSQSLIVLLGGIALTSILLGAFAPISLLFLASGSDYPFLLLMHVLIFAFCGAAGLYSIHRNFMVIRRESGDGNLTTPSAHVLKVWMLLYMFVGTQTAYILSPFVNRDPRLHPARRAERELLQLPLVGDQGTAAVIGSDGRQLEAFAVRRNSSRQQRAGPVGLPRFPALLVD